jgi:RNA polymerase sigma factor (sigma-70 family)
MPIFSTLSLLHPKLGCRSPCTKKARTLFFLSFCTETTGKRKGGLLMKSHKTKQENRGTYTYIFDDGTKITIKPGEEGVTEEFIKKLHSLDDSEVYYNHKNWHRPISEKEKQDIKDWEEKHPGEKYQEIWNLSIDSIFDEEGNQDKCIYLADNTTAVEDTSDEVDRLREVVSMMTEKQQRVYELHFLEGYSLTEVAAIMGTSIPSVHKHKEKILKFIKENFKRG